MTQADTQGVPPPHSGSSTALAGILVALCGMIICLMSENLPEGTDVLGVYTTTSGCILLVAGYLFNSLKGGGRGKL